MPQLLHILDEKMYSHKSAINDVIIPTSLDKRMSFGHLYNIIATNDNDADDEDNEDTKNESSTTITVINNNVRSGKNERLNDMDDSLAPFRCVKNIYYYYYYYLFIYKVTIYGCVNSFFHTKLKSV